MRTYNAYFSDKEALASFLSRNSLKDNTKLLVQVFTSVTDESVLSCMVDDLIDIFPTAALIGSTTDGEICSGTVSTGKTVISVTQFEQTHLAVAAINNTDSDSFKTGCSLGKSLISNDTKALIVFADGLHCNGEALLHGIASVDSTPTVSGGLAGDNGHFKQTFVFTGQGILSRGAVGVALDNPDLNVHSDYSFNWQPIGKTMHITDIKGNRVYTIDGTPPTEIYRHYLGDEVAEGLPAIGVEFPLIIHRGKTKIARAVLAKHDDGSLSFGGDFSVGDTVRFGHGDATLILEQANVPVDRIDGQPVESLFVYSCMARRRFMPNLIHNELIPLQKLTDISGFFTYSEFFSCGGQSELMNQTMTILALSETNNSVVRPSEQASRQNELNDYQKTTRALSHLLDVTTHEMAQRHRQLEEENKTIEAKRDALKQAQVVGHLGSWEVDMTTKRSVWSEESYNIYRLDPATTEPTLDTFMSMLLKEDIPKAEAALKEIYDEKIHAVDLRVRRADGVVITVLLNAKLISDEKNRPLKLVGTTLDITEQVKLREQNEELAAIIEDSTNEVYIIEQKTHRFLYVNSQALTALGYTREEMMQMRIYDINPALTPDEANAIEIKLMQNGSLVNQTIHTRKDGSTYPVHSYLQHKKFNNKDVAIIFDVDVSELYEAEQKQKQQAQILEQINDSVISTDLDDIITHWNNGATVLHGYRKEEMLGRSVNMLYLPEEMKKIHFIKAQALEHGVYRDQVKKRNKQGDIIYTNLTVSVLRDDSDRIIGLTRYSQDRTRQKAVEDELKAQTKLLNHQAYHDTLTGLPNRALFEDRLKQSILTAHHHQEYFALLFIDLDNFKQINDTLGHTVGDDVLKITAQRLSKCISENDTLARLGGDEFTIILQDMESQHVVIEIAGRIFDTLKPKIGIGTHELHISASIGISLYPKDADNEEDLLKYADTAMYKAKDEGKAQFQFYSSDMTDRALQKAMIETGMHKAIEAEEFSVYYQPQINAEDGTVYGLEALLRWQHPNMGMILPDQFIPVAEENNLIHKLGNFAMRRAMQDMRRWYGEGLKPGILSLNLSIVQLSNPEYIAELNNAIAQTKFDLRWLELEITETQMMRNPMKSIEIFNTLSAMGIEIAIDDFGTGYSSLAYLKRLPVNKLKIDKSFVMDLPDDEEDRAIIDAVMALAKSMKLTVIAEGVETLEQSKYLGQLGCHFFQGYYYAKPMPADAVETFLKERITP